jgi:pilus assembly protein Flp/PilA
MSSTAERMENVASGLLWAYSESGGMIMRKMLTLMKRLGKEEEGAALVEYSVLLGVMLVAVIGTIVLVGGWINTKWTALLTALSGN